MIMMEHDAVLVVVHIRRVLEEPLLLVQRERNRPQVLAGRVVQTSGIADVLPAEQAFRIDRRRKQPGHRDLLRILLRLGQVDRHLQIAIRRGLQPVDILGDAVHPDIVGIDAELVEAVCRGGNAFILCQLNKLPVDLRGAGHELAHDFGVQEIPVRIGILRDQPNFEAIIDKGIQRSLRSLKLRQIRFAVIRLAEAELLQQPVAAVVGVCRLDKPPAGSEEHELIDRKKGALGSFCSVPFVSHCVVLLRYGRLR
ncbi:hypothetical protein D3C71_1309570 [compost metagenome]